MPKHLTIDEFIQLVNGSLAEMLAMNERHADAPIERWFSALRETCDEHLDAEVFDA